MYLSSGEFSYTHMVINIVKCKTFVLLDDGPVSNKSRGSLVMHQTQTLDALHTDDHDDVCACHWLEKATCTRSSIGQVSS
jgi:hypothetical protein